MARGRRQGQAIHEAEQDKRRRHPELLTGTRCHFFVLAFEVAGRWSPSSVLEEFGLVQGLSPCPESFALQPNFILPALDGLCWLAPSSERTLPVCWGKPLGTCACVNGPAVHVGCLDRLPCA